jgi:hypothetical protein
MRIGEKPKDLERKDTLGGIKWGWGFLGIAVTQPFNVYVWMICELCIITD